MSSTLRVSHPDNPWSTIYLRYYKPVFDRVLENSTPVLRFECNYGIASQCGGKTYVPEILDREKIKRAVRLAESILSRYGETVPTDAPDCEELYREADKLRDVFNGVVDARAPDFTLAGLWRMVARTPEEVEAIERAHGQELDIVGATKVTTKSLTTWVWGNSPRIAYDDYGYDEDEDYEYEINPYEESREHALSVSHPIKQYNRRKFIEDVMAILRDPELEGAEVITLTTNYLYDYHCGQVLTMALTTERVGNYLWPGDIPGLTKVHFCVAQNPNEHYHDIGMATLFFEDGVPSCLSKRPVPSGYLYGINNDVKNSYVERDGSVRELMNVPVRTIYNIRMTHAGRPDPYRQALGYSD
jgi:hypothetical protein